MPNNSNALQIETLEKEIQNTQIKYEEAYKNYLSLLNSHDATNTFTNLSGRTYWGNKGLSQGTANSAGDCQAMCSSNKLCTGATFNSTSKFCFVRGGEGEIMPGTATTFAVMTKMQEANLTLKALNDKMLLLMQQLNVLIQQNRPNYDIAFVDMNNKGLKLNTSYDELLRQKREIDKMLQQYQTISNDYSDTTLQVKQHYFIYKLFYVLIFVIIFIVSMIMMNALNSISIVFMLLIISLLFYVFEMLTISAVIALFTVIYVMGRSPLKPPTSF